MLGLGTLDHIKSPAENPSVAFRLCKNITIPDVPEFYVRGAQVPTPEHFAEESIIFSHKAALITVIVSTAQKEASYGKPLRFCGWCREDRLDVLTQMTNVSSEVGSDRAKKLKPWDPFLGRVLGKIVVCSQSFLRRRGDRT